MIRTKPSFTRRDFLKLSGLGMGALAMQPLTRSVLLPEFPEAGHLGRNCTGGMIPVKTLPDINSTTVRDVYEDTIFPWLREVPARNPDYGRINQRWVETDEGYVYAPYLQPCLNQPNTPLTSLPVGQPGFWAEVTIPYVDFTLDKDPASPGFKYLVGNGLATRLYYSQVMWIDQIDVTDVGTVLYRVSERYGSYGDVLWAEGAAFRPITEAEIAPISPEIDSAEKKVVVNVTYQTLACLEQGKEVYFCRVSTGAGGGATPTGDHATWRKTISIHMAGGTVAAGYDTPGIAWTTLFSGEGVAVHSTFWHNDFGMARSHGCVNCKPEDAKWVFRWTAPQVPLEPGDITWGDWKTGSSHVVVEQRLY